MPERIPQDVLEKYLWDSAKLLRTNIDAGSYKQYIFPLLFFKRLCDVFDEKKSADEAKYGADAALYADDYLFKIPQGAHWRDVREVSEDVGEALVRAFKAIENENPEQLTGIFGDAAWTNKKRLPDRLLKSLLEHFSGQTLSLARCPEDELGKGYEYLIKQFADDSGHTAQEFYTNRTVVALMTEMLQPRPKESIYDPTCGSGGMLISAIKWLKDRGEEYRNVRIYGQEINAITSAIARMNLFLHGIADFHIVNADTLKYPAFVKNGKLQTFDMVLANPPYSISQWDRTAFEDDKWGRNFLGTPPQGRADYAFFQHILKSLDSKTGRCAILFPHGILFREEEDGMRKKLVESDLVECVIGIGKNLFYNSPMEASIVVCRTNKPPKRRGKVLFIDARKEVTRKNSESFLEPEHIKKIAAAYKAFEPIDGFAAVASADEILSNHSRLSIPLYVCGESDEVEQVGFDEALVDWYGKSDSSSEAFAELTGAAFATDRYMRAMPLAQTSSGEKKKFRFAEIADSSKEKRMPVPDDKANYIGLEHLDTEDLDVHRWGSDVDITGQKLVMKKGDLLFGRRNTYLRRAAIAPHDGLFSAHGMILRPNDKVVDPRFFPFFILSDYFMDAAIRISVGSLSPTVNWSTLKELEFSLPPLAEQKKLAETLWAMERVKRAYKSLLAQTDALAQARFVEMFGDGQCPLVRTEDVCGFITKGTTPKSNQIIERYEDGLVPYLKVYNLSSNGQLLFDAHPQFVSRMTHENFLGRSKVYPNDVLMNIVGPPLGKFSLVTDEYPEWNVNQAIAIFRATKKILPEFLLYSLRSDGVLKPLLEKASGVRQLNLSLEQCREIQIPLPPLALQREFAAFIAQQEKAKASLKESLAALTAAQKALMNSSFAKATDDKRACKDL